MLSLIDALLLEKYQLEIVRSEGLPPLLRLLHSSYLPLILSAAACVRNVSIHPSNESPIIESGFLQPLIDLLSFDENEEVQCHAISTLRNLAASSEKNKGAIVEAGAVEKIKELVLSVPLNVQSEMTACVAVLALSGEFAIEPDVRLSHDRQSLSFPVNHPLQTTSSRNCSTPESAKSLSLSPTRHQSKSKGTVLPPSVTSPRRRRTTTTPSTRCGTSPKVDSTRTSFGSSAHLIRHSSTLPFGP